MRAATAAALVEEAGRPPVRLRYVLLLLSLVLAGSYVAPRLQAAWRLHALATTFADYALCMAGPTGPSLLRDNPAEFWKVARRRLVTSSADGRPFEHCAKAGGALTGSIEVERAHLARAWDFVEYGGEAADRAAAGSTGEVSFADLSVNTHVLARLAEDAKPFVREGYTQLVQPSSAAFEATHPIELPRPALGRGLPDGVSRYRVARLTRLGWLLSVGQGQTLGAYVSQDAGTTWKVAPLHQAGLAQIAGRCVAGETGAAFTFGVSADRKLRTVGWELADGTTGFAPLTDAATTSVVAASCDADALIAAIAHKGTHVPTLHLCRLQDSCASMPVPSFPGVKNAPSYAVDVARADGITAVAMTMHGIVRVTSSRDDGQTWAPWTVAYDAAEFPDLPQRPPSHLLVMGKKLLLYAGGPESAAYPFLISTDYGASFRAP